jgi:hypothetical protein
LGSESVADSRLRCAWSSKQALLHDYENHQLTANSGTKLLFVMKALHGAFWMKKAIFRAIRNRVSIPQYVSGHRS